MVTTNINSLTQLQTLIQTNSTEKINLVITSNSNSPGFSLIQLLTALELIRHSHLRLVSISGNLGISTEILSQALFQTQWYYPGISLKPHNDNI